MDKYFMHCVNLMSKAAAVAGPFEKDRMESLELPQIAFQMVKAPRKPRRISMNLR